jgi:uncharacterized membrane protein
MTNRSAVPVKANDSALKWFFGMLSATVSLYLLLNTQDFRKSGAETFSVIFSPAYVCGFCALAAAMWIIFMKAAGTRKARMDSRNMPAYLVFSVSLFALCACLSFFRGSNRFILCLFNFIPAGAVATLWYFFGMFEKNSPGPDNGKKDLYTAGAACSVLIALACFSGFSWHDAFFTFAKDFGIFQNAIWRIGFDGTQYNVIEGMADHRGVHFQPFMYLPALLFTIKCSPYILIVLQAFFSLGAAVFLYLISGKLLKKSAAALLVSLAFLAGTYTARTFVFDYHPESAYMFMFLGFMYFAESENFLMSAVFLALAASVKEEAAVYTAAASVFIFLRNRDARYIILAACSLAYAAVVIEIVIPAFGGASAGFLGLMARNILQAGGNGIHPDYLLQLGVFLLSALFLPVLDAASFLLVFLPPAIVHSSHYSAHAALLFDTQYAAFVVPALFLGVVYSLKRLADKGKIAPGNLMLALFTVFLLQCQAHFSLMSVYDPVYVAASTLWLALVLVPVFIPDRAGASLRNAVFAVMAITVFCGGYLNCYSFRLGMVEAGHRKSINEAISRLPEGPAVITNSNIVPHVCCRKLVWSLDTGTAEEVMRPVEKLKLDEFYMLIYLYDFTYRLERIEPGLRNRELFGLAEKMGFKHQILYNDNISGVARFSR